MVTKEVVKLLERGAHKIIIIAVYLDTGWT